ncbi:hypothetical protein EON66_03940 [archaeon]|nr:MAG: hypothetical protein EON66_03940 [archaeon]
MAVTPSSCTFSEAPAAFVHVAASSVVIADADDDNMYQARISIQQSDADGSYAACDASRDKLELLPGYDGTASVLYGQWYPSLCTLMLASLQEGMSVTKAQMETAIRKVRYINLDAKNPTNYLTSPAWRLKRGVSIAVQDDGMRGAAGIRLFSTAAAVTLTITPVDGMLCSAIALHICGLVWVSHTLRPSRARAPCAASLSC